MKFFTIAIVLVFSLVQLSCASAIMLYDKDQLKVYQQEALDRLYDCGYLDSQISAEMAYSQISIPLENEYMSSSVLIDDTVYISGVSGIFEVSTNGDYTCYPYRDSDGKTNDFIVRLLNTDGELWAYVQRKDGILGKEIETCYYARVSLDNGYIKLEKIQEIAAELYKLPIDGEVGEQMYAYYQDGKVYSIDRVSEEPRAESLIEIDISNGCGREVCRIPAVMSVIPYDQNKALVLNASLITFGSLGPTYLSFWENFEAATGLGRCDRGLMFVDLKDGEISLVWGFDTVIHEQAAQASGFAYDADSDRIYYGYKGELHCMYGLDPATDMVIAPAPGNYLRFSADWCTSFITSDGYYVTVIPYVGVDIIPIVEQGNE